MDTLSITEGLVALLVEREGVDATNAIQLLRTAQDKCVEVFGVVEKDQPTATHPNALRERWLNRRRESDQVDNVIILVTRNGQEDLFS